MNARLGAVVLGVMTAACSRAGEGDVAPPAADIAKGPCRLMPTPAADGARLLQYLKQGMNYASQKKPELALAEYKRVVEIDPHFLGAQGNVGSALLALERYEAAENQFKQELSSLSCLEPLTDADLADFAYMIETETRAPGDTVRVYRARLRETKATTFYNLACVYSLQNRVEDALGALRTAVDSGFSDVGALKQDPDLKNVRETEAFREIVAAIQ